MELFTRQRQITKTYIISQDEKGVVRVVLGAEHYTVECKESLFERMAFGQRQELRERSKQKPELNTFETQNP
jgi:hypothetical protein